MYLGKLINALGKNGKMLANISHMWTHVMLTDKLLKRRTPYVAK